MSDSGEDHNVSNLKSDMKNLGGKKTTFSQGFVCSCGAVNLNDREPTVLQDMIAPNTNHA